VKLFGTRILQILLGITVLTFTMGCSRSSDTRQVSGDVKTRIPWADEGGEYSLQEVLLKGISSLYELSGSYVTFYIYPSTRGTKISGTNPKTRFLKSGEVYVPEDALTQQMTVIYAHMQNMAEMDKEMGAEGINTWPRDVGISVRFTNEATGRYETDNAFYDGQTDSMLIVPYTQDNLPIPVNAGILAHEHFHSLYFKLVEKTVFKSRLPIHGENLRKEVLGTGIVEHNVIKPASHGKSDSEDYQEFFSRGINEGLADFWAWVYTGDPEFLASSLPSEQKARSLKLEEAPKKFMTAEDYKFRINNRIYKSEVGEQCLGLRVAYCLGSDYARTLKYLAGVVQDTRGLTSIEARRIVGKAVVKALPLLKDALLGVKENELFEPVQFFAMVKDSMSELQTPEKTLLENLVKTTLKPKTENKENTKENPQVTITEVTDDVKIKSRSPR
jgi:hypothetical protein